MKLQNIKKIALTSAFIVGNTLALNANATSTTVSVGGVTYTVTLSGLGNYNTLSSSIQSGTIWGSSSLAQSIATAVGTSLGTPNVGGSIGPRFGYAVDGVTGKINNYAYFNGSINSFSGTFGISTSSSAYWALVSTGGSSSSGPSLENTQASVANSAQALQGTYALQNSIIANSFSYDCTVFGENNVCISAGGRNTAVAAANGLNNTSALLIAAYRALPSVRIGAYADQNLSVNNGGSTVNLGNNTPLIGLFAAWNERQDGTGSEVKVSAAYGQKNTTINRGVVGSGSTASEAGSGSSQLNSQGFQVLGKHGFGVMQDVVVY